MSESENIICLFIQVMGIFGLDWFVSHPLAPSNCCFIYNPTDNRSSWLKFRENYHLLTSAKHIKVAWMRLMMQINKPHILVKQPSISEGRKNKPAPAKTIWSHSRLTPFSSLRRNLKAKGSTDITADRCRKALAQHHKEKTHSLVMSV